MALKSITISPQKSNEKSPKKLPQKIAQKGQIFALQEVVSLKIQHLDKGQKADHSSKKRTNEFGVFCLKQY